MTTADEAFAPFARAVAERRPPDEYEYETARTWAEAYGGVRCELYLLGASLRAWEGNWREANDWLALATLHAMAPLVASIARA